MATGPEAGWGVLQAALMCQAARLPGTLAGWEVALMTNPVAARRKPCPAVALPHADGLGWKARRRTLASQLAAAPTASWVFGWRVPQASS